MTNITLKKGNQNIALVFDGNGTLTHRYLFGDGIDRIEADEQVATNTTLWALTDHLGSVRDVVDNSGTVQNHIVYDAFGNITSQTNSTVVFRNSYTGQEFDSESGLFSYGGRYYDPFTGKFIQEDKIGFSGQDANLYRYVKNNSVNYTDPTGYLVGEPSEFRVRVPIPPAPPISAPTGPTRIPGFPKFNPVLELIKQLVFPEPTADDDTITPISNRIRQSPKPTVKKNVPMGEFSYNRAFSPYKPDPNSCQDKKKKECIPKSSNITLGGSYSEVRATNEGGEVHHMPSYGGISKSGIALSRGKAPAICMTIMDHQQTASHSSKTYTDKQAGSIITLGRFGFEVAQNSDILDVRGKFGSKYDFGIIQMQNYSQQLLSKLFR